MSLSPPTSSVRITTGSGEKAFAALQYASNCSSSSGALVRSIYRNSVRNKPTPSASAALADSASSTLPILAKISLIVPEAVTLFFPLKTFNRSLCSWNISAFLLYSFFVSLSGSCRTIPLIPSRIRVLPFSMSVRAPVTPSTAGIPSARARIAA